MNSVVDKPELFVFTVKPLNKGNSLIKKFAYMDKIVNINLIPYKRGLTVYPVSS